MEPIKARRSAYWNADGELAYRAVEDVEALVAEVERLRRELVTVEDQAYARGWSECIDSNRL